MKNLKNIFLFTTQICLSSIAADLGKTVIHWPILNTPSEYAEYFNALGNKLDTNELGYLLKDEAEWKEFLEEADEEKLRAAGLRKDSPFPISR